MRTSLAPAARSFLWPTLATIVFVALCVTAGNWQRARMHEKEALAAALAAADRAAPMALPTAARDWEALRYRRVVAQGQFDAHDQFLLDNRVHEGRVGFDVVTPLALPDGAWVLVDRGFVEVHDRRVLPHAPPPPGDVTVEGRVELPVRGFLMGNPPPQGPLWPHLDPARYAERSGRRVLPIYLEATGDIGAGLARDWPAPDLGTERHLGYVFQWYTFAAMAAGLWIYFAWRRWRGR